MSGEVRGHPQGEGCMLDQLDRSGFVPLYYQLQEIIKEQIESGAWASGDRLPSEPELARRFGVSRVVVRQALAILKDDRQIVRIKGRGTFVAKPKLDFRAGGLLRVLASPRSHGLRLHVLDKRLTVVEGEIQENLAVSPGERVLRVTTLLSLDDMPLAISYSFFRPDDVAWLVEAAHVGRSIPRDLVLAHYGVRLTHSRVRIETSQCGQFEADRFGVPYRSAVFLVLCTEYCSTLDGQRPVEVARVEYRGDILRFQLEVPSPQAAGELAATWSLTETVTGRAPSDPVRR